MKPMVRGERASATTVELRCRNCGEPVFVSPESDRAHCRRCSNVWNWKTKQPIRGQR